MTISRNMRSSLLLLGVAAFVYATPATATVRICNSTAMAVVPGGNLPTDPMAESNVGNSAPQYRWAFFEAPRPAIATEATTINNRGEIGGSYFDGSVEHMFLLDHGNFTTLDFPDTNGLQTTLTFPTDMNDQGDIVGFFGHNADFHGFHYHHGVFHQLDRPGYVSAFPSGINDAGEIIGTSIADDGSIAGFRYRDGVFETAQPDLPPGATFAGFADINNRGAFIGAFSGLNGLVSYEARHGLSVTFNAPHGIQTLASGINDGNEVVGWYFDTDLFSHGFLYRDGRYTTVDLPFQTHFANWLHVNNRGEIVGWAMSE